MIASQTAESFNPHSQTGQIKICRIGNRQTGPIVERQVDISSFTHAPRRRNEDLALASATRRSTRNRDRLPSGYEN